MTEKTDDSSQVFDDNIAALTRSNVTDYLLFLGHQDTGNNDLTNLKLQKLVYYAQALHLGLFGKPLFNEPIEAWEHGPVISDMYHEFKGCKDNPVPYTGLDLSIYSTKIQEYLTEVYNTYSQCSGWKLRDLTHITNSPWDLVYKNLSSNLEIPIALMKRFYEVIISIGVEFDHLKSLKEKIAFCYNVEEAASKNLDLPIDFIAASLVKNGVRFNSLDD